jgi:hypothetical protein
MLTLCSYQVLIMFPINFHDVFNMFFKFPLYSLTHSQEHLTFIPYGLANVVLLSFIYIIKVVFLLCDTEIFESIMFWTAFLISSESY